MSKMTNNWEMPISSFVPYLQWSELSKGALDFWRSGRHNHAAYEFHIIVSGSSDLFVNNARVEIKAGQGILISPEVYHAPENVEKPFGRISATFFPDKSLIERLSLNSMGEYRVFDVDNSILLLCDSICEEAKRQDNPFHKELMANQFASLILRVLRIIKETSELAPAVSNQQKQTEDMTVIDLFFVNTPPKMRTKQNLAKLLHCSQRQVLRKVYSLYGISFQKKLLLSRMDTAQHLLSTTDKSIEEICAIIGYADKAAFYKAFSQHAKTTPIKYRKKFRQ